ncbi:MAG: ABC transporter ATP-binding protein/permease [Oscillospiraceae bacterium]|nr:ABC transporter ATP-binding protein/permease [Oscillospiraceae bacterium]
METDASRRSPRFNFRIRKPQGMLARIFGRLRPYRGRIAAGVAMLAAAQTLRLLFPLITREVVNNVIPNRDFALMWRLGGLLVGLTIIRLFLLYSRGMLFERMSQDAIYQLRTDLYARLQAQSHAFYDTHRIGEIMSRMTGDLEGVRNFIMNFCQTMCEQAIMFIGALAFMGSISWLLTAVTLASAVPLTVFAYFFNKKIRPAHAAVREQNAVLNTRAQENIAGVRVVKAFAREPYESEQFMKDNQKVRSLHMNATLIWSNFNPVMDFLSSLSVPAMLLVGGTLVQRGALDLGSLIAATGYVWVLVNPLRMLANFVNVYAQGLSSAEKLFYYLDLGTTVKDPREIEEPQARLGHVKLENVTFAYRDQIVLRDVSLEAKPGETVAIMGATGSGKTTLLYLLARFYDIRSGSVMVDGVDVRRQSLPRLRRSIGFVMQDTFLFSDSIRENVGFGQPGLDMDEVESAARTAQAYPFIEKLPQGWETVVGERGLGLSGGQKQRVSIARALAYDPKILVLDDATSAVDMETEADIQRGLAELSGQRTTFIIAHRISSVIHADQIIVLDDGQVAERGSHSELLEKKGLYHQMFMDQVRDFVDLDGVKGA